MYMQRSGAVPGTEAAIALSFSGTVADASVPAVIEEFLDLGTE
jgi:hypothetical protein